MSKISIEKKTISNKAYRRVLETTDQLQVVVMCLLPNQDIPEEVHPHTTQFIRIEKGSALVKVNGKLSHLVAGDSIVIPSGKKHYVKNSSLKDPLQLYTIYSPPEHPPGLIQKKMISPT